MSVKHMLKYKVVHGYNPRTGGVVSRPMIVDREIYGLDRAIDYAVTCGYIRGQREEVKGIANGLFEAIKSLALMGNTVRVGDWFKFHPELTGTVDESRRLSDKNELYVALRPLSSLKIRTKDFEWKNVDDTSIIPKIESIASEGGAFPDVVVKNKDISIVGKNLQFDEAKGDNATVSWIDDGERMIIPIFLSEGSRAQMMFHWPEELNHVPEGTELTFVFHTCGGGNDGPVYKQTRKAKVVVGDSWLVGGGS